MASKKSVFILITALIMMAFITVGCERSYAPIEESQATPTMDGEFPEALPSDMEDVFESGAQTATALAIASSAAPVESGPTPLAPSTTTPDASDDPASPTPSVAASAESTLPVIATSTNTPTTSSDPKLSTYTLKKGEFPYCIARRFNVDPGELLALNNLTTAQAQSLQPGLTLNIPQGGKVFPPPRALNTHPDNNYKVPQSMTVYAVACYFGDIDPDAIISANTIPDINNIPAGTILQIP